MKHSSAILPVLLILLTVGSRMHAQSAAPHSASNSSPFADVDRIMNAAVARANIPGGVVLVGHDGKVVYRKAFGMRSLEPSHEAMTVDTIFDIGVAGIHRLMNNRERLMSARVVVVCAGMEGALPSVVAGMVGVPVIAVPSSVGYGASFRGLAALLGMLNSCSPNVCVVNIDNGFGAGYLASVMNRL